QVCSATSRVLVHDSIYDELITRLVQEAEKIVIGHGMTQDVQLGPIVNKKQYDAIIATLEQGDSDGVNVLTGGKRASGFDKGYFIEPTVFGDVPEDHPIWTDEIFGPVVALRRFKDETEAVASANNSELGLAAGVISKDIDRANRVARNLKAGIVWVNCSQPLFLQAPWGGYKQSGIGRELGTWGLDNYLETKQITTYHNEAPLGWYLK
ncbi:MAG: aldehyde dehydrogenase family protein, partial [Psychrobacter sp.]